MKYIVIQKKKITKKLKSFPKPVQKRYKLLVDDMVEFGPIQPEWPNYSKLSRYTYHCHIHPNYVACWTHYKNTIEIEVYYVGSKEDAPYNTKKSQK